MYVNKCIKCGKEFETKNPKRVICPDCLYSDKKYTEELADEAAKTVQSSDDKTERNSYSFGGGQNERPYRPFDRQDRNQQGGRPFYNRNNPNRGYTPGYNRPRPQGYQNYRQAPAGQQDAQGMQERQGFQNQGGYQRPYNNRFGGQKFQRPQGQGGFQRPPRPGFKPRRPGGPKRQKQLLISKEQLEQIEILYKKALPLPNPDVHEVIGQAVQLEPRKVFFGINLIRQKLMLPKLPFPKRKLAVTPDQMFAVKNLYEPLLPLPPIGCHKIIAAQLRMDEWRVHVAIGLIRKQMGLGRWNQDREDAPEEYKNKSEQTEQPGNNE